MRLKNSLPNQKKKQPPINSRPQTIICFCHNISKEVIEAAITDGAHTLDDIYRITTAGVGPCGGSCRRNIARLLSSIYEDEKK
jgi:NAD(P)H-nitrite reductase large subunit